VIVRAVAAAQAALALVAGAIPDVAVVDIRLPPSFTDEGLRLANDLRERGVSVLVLSQYAVPSYATALLAGGESGRAARSWTQRSPRQWPRRAAGTAPGRRGSHAPYDADGRAEDRCGGLLAGSRAGFGLPALVGTLHFARSGEVWTLADFPAYGDGPFERVGVPTSVPPLVAFALVCLAELAVAVMLLADTPHAAVASYALLPVEVVFWIGFALPYGPPLGIARTILLLVRTPGQHDCANHAIATPDDESVTRRRWRDCIVLWWMDAQEPGRLPGLHDLAQPVGVDAVLNRAPGSATRGAVSPSARPGTTFGRPVTASYLTRSTFQNQ
jgi:CheY-like chemotaxis protein